MAPGREAADEGEKMLGGLALGEDHLRGAGPMPTAGVVPGDAPHPDLPGGIGGSPAGRPCDHRGPTRQR
jgi:hypothetical protein